MVKQFGQADIRIDVIFNWASLFHRLRHTLDKTLVKMSRVQNPVFLEFLRNLFYRCKSWNNMRHFFQFSWMSFLCTKGLGVIFKNEVCYVHKNMRPLWPFFHNVSRAKGALRNAKEISLWMATAVLLERKYRKEPEIAWKNDAFWFTVASVNRL